jgi:RNA polymerase sigma factor (sigma-70 family)
LKPEYTEAEIVAGCVQNNRSFQELLYRQHFAKMMHLCLRYCNGDRERALEILNDGFLRIFKKINTFEFKGSLEGWIRRLVFHAVSDYFKANKQYIDAVVFEEPENTHTIQAIPAKENTGLNHLYFEDILKLVETLPPATREVFRLYAIDGYNHNEIAEQLSISVGTSKWHLSTAREKLKILILDNSNLL